MSVSRVAASATHYYSVNDNGTQQGNYNNDVGVPLTLLRLQPRHRLAVVELGMNHPGEIVGLAHMAAPTVALVDVDTIAPIDFSEADAQFFAELNAAAADFNPQAIRRTIDGIRSDAGAVRSAYTAVRGAAGNPLERGR
mgnify:CR=1 FL=1